MNELIVIETASKTIVGELITKTETSARIKNPAALFIQPSNSGQLSVQLFPLFFGELIETSEREQGTVWDFNTAGCGVGEGIKLDSKLVEQYTRIFNPSKIITPPHSDKVIKLFDD
jgi:hypothetical protein